ncbi:ABC transporter substrate-binding protein [Paenibacillus roseipurpureus]|uniref:ABC transporter substrate-binding protein n=1 Tax=Paenibacillus roseopurpureus TaxID=2918901 RepID=A0AA96LRK8_9BACL|nr:ABC transporter substrate-binding protein [Paenibacillus sp. MBLB1832]WNR44533.1 ABC transporter substrate-binding protein [Paenibacillus sp. MBLB1832]
MKVKAGIVKSVLPWMLISSVAIVGCSKEGDGTAVKSSAAPGSTAQSQLAPRELNWYYTGPGPQKDVALIEEKMNAYLKDKINATVKLHALDWGSYDQKISTLLASGESIDLVVSNSWAFQYPNAVAKGQLTDLTPLLDKYAPETKKLLSERNWLEPQAINGKVYNLPTIKEMASQAGIMFNKDLADKFGIDVTKIKTYKDLEQVFKVVKEKDPSITPFAMTNGLDVIHAGLGWDLTIPYSISTGIYLDPSTDKWAPIFSNPIYKDYLTQTRNYYTEGYINKDAATLKDVVPLMKSGKAFSYPSQLKPGNDKEASKSYGVNLVQVPLSKVVSTQGDLTNSMMAIPTTSKDPARALMFYNLMYTDPYLINLMDYGIEGTHWVWLDKEKQIIDFAPATNGGKDSGWNHGTNWLFGNQLLSYIFKGEDPNKWKNFEEFNKSATRGPDFGFTFDSEPVKREVAALKNVDTEFKEPMFAGAIDLDKYLPTYENKAKDAGLLKVIDEMNKQYEAFKAKKK